MQFLKQSAQKKNNTTADWDRKKRWSQKVAAANDGVNDILVTVAVKADF